MPKQSKAKVSERPIWTGTITIGLVNVPIKLHTMIYNKSISFRFLHKKDGQPLKYERVCTKDGMIVPWEDTERGYEVAKNEFVTFKKEELEASRPPSDQKIRIDKFIDFLSVDPIYFDRTYVLSPQKNDDSYNLLLTALQSMGKTGVGKITLRTKEYPILVHPYKGSLVLTTLRYAYEVADPKNLEELAQLKEPGKDELSIAKKIIQDLSGEFDITEYKDGYKDKIYELIEKKLKGEIIQVEKPVKEEAKELMVALQETLKQLKKNEP